MRFSYLVSHLVHCQIKTKPPIIYILKSPWSVNSYLAYLLRSTRDELYFKNSLIIEIFM